MSTITESLPETPLTPLRLRQRPPTDDSSQDITRKVISAAWNGNLATLMAADPSQIDLFTLFETAEKELFLDSSIPGRYSFNEGESLGSLVTIFFKFPAIFASSEELSEMGQILKPALSSRFSGSLQESVRRAFTDHVMVCKHEMETTSLGYLSILGWNTVTNIGLRGLGLTTHLIRLYRTAEVRHATAK